MAQPGITHLHYYWQ